DNSVHLSLSDYSNCTVGGGGNGDCAGGFGVGGPNYRSTYDTEYTGNIMYSLHSGQLAMLQENAWAASYANAVKFGTFTNNYYFNPFSDVPIHQRFHYNV